MYKLTSLFAVTMLFASSPAWSGADNVTDLTYCLGLRTNLEIAKCSGEVSAGSRKKPYTREQVEELMAQEEKSAPAPGGAPAAPVKAPASSEEPPVDAVEVPVQPTATDEAPVQPAARDEAPVQPAAIDETPVQPTAVGENAGMEAAPGNAK